MRLADRLLAENEHVGSSAAAPWTHAAHRWAWALALVACSAGLAHLGYLLSAPRGYPTFWPLAGLGLAVLLLSERRDWPVAVALMGLASVSVDVLNGAPLVIALGDELAGGIEIVLTAALLQRLAARRVDLLSVRQAAQFVFFGTLVGPALGASLGTAADVLTGSEFAWYHVWVIWWISEVTGVMVVAPAVLLGVSRFREWRASPPEEFSRSWRMATAGVATSAAFAVVSWYVFGQVSEPSRWQFFLVSGVIAAGAVGGPFAAATGFAAMAVASIAGLASSAPETTVITVAHGLKVLQVQGFLVVSGATALLLSVSIYDNRRLGQRAVAESQRVSASARRLEGMVRQVVAVIGNVVEMRDPYTQGHERGVAVLSRLIAAEMGLPDDLVDGIEVAAQLHDVGKLSVPSDILTKPGALTELQYEFIRRHSEAGHEILQGIDFDWPIAEYVLQHHERMDGSGYPSGLVGDEILIGSRVLMVADVLEAMSSHRPYRPAKSMDEAMAEIVERPGCFVSDVVAACVRLHEKGLLASSLVRVAS